MTSLLSKSNLAVRWTIFFLLSFVFLYAEKPAFNNRVRHFVLKRSDVFLDLVTTQNGKEYASRSPLYGRPYKNQLRALRVFAEKYGYFALERPLIARVTANEEDLSFVLKLFETMGRETVEMPFASAELLTKVLAYRDLTVGLRLFLPTNEGVEPFIVDCVFDLWQGMPAFGLVPEKEGVPSLLLFRGTDFSLDSRRGLASLLSDVDLEGPGHFVFLQARTQIHDWLQRVVSLNKRAIALGFSLGGILAAYTYLYEGELLCETGNSAFAPPGMSKKVLAEWEALPQARRKKFLSYVNQGDLVSKTGYLFGKVYALRPQKQLKPLYAHTVLMCGQEEVFSAEVDVDAENERRSGI